MERSPSVAVKVGSPVGFEPGSSHQVHYPIRNPTAYTWTYWCVLVDWYGNRVIEETVTLAPGGSYTFDQWITMPTAGGTYYLVCGVRLDNEAGQLLHSSVCEIINIAETCTDGDLKCEMGKGYECRNSAWVEVGTCDVDREMRGMLWWDDGVPPHFQRGSTHTAHVRVENGWVTAHVVKVAIILSVIAEHVSLPGYGEIRCDGTLTVTNIPGTYFCGIVMQDENTGEQWTMYGDLLVVF